MRKAAWSVLVVVAASGLLPASGGPNSRHPSLRDLVFMAGRWGGTLGNGSGVIEESYAEPADALIVQA